MSDQRLRELLKQAVCEHKSRTGGNDYLLCNDCDLMWNYCREGPHDALKRQVGAALAAIELEGL